MVQVQRTCDLMTKLRYFWPHSVIINVWQGVTCHLTVCGFMVWLLHSSRFCKASSFWERVWISKQPGVHLHVCVFYPLFVCSFWWLCILSWWSSKRESNHCDLWWQATLTAPSLVSWQDQSGSGWKDQSINHLVNWQKINNNFRIWYILKVIYQTKMQGYLLASASQTWGFALFLFDCKVDR